VLQRERGGVVHRLQVSMHAGVHEHARVEHLRRERMRVQRGQVRRRRALCEEGAVAVAGSVTRNTIHHLGRPASLATA
jgi:hypothetical protein